MNVFMIVSIAVAAVFVLAVGYLIYRRLPKKLKVDDYTREWRELQALLKDKTQWSEAVTKADKLLDKALKRRKFKGKTMGERMVSAQRKFTSNDDLWFAHNFYKKVAEDPAKRLKEVDVKDALVGFRQALKDLGAFQSSEVQKSETETPEVKK